MKPQNSIDRKRMKIRFIALYIVSLVMLGVVFAALTTGSKTGKANNAADEQAFLEEKQLFRIYSLLQNDIQQLQKMDGEYMQLITDSAAMANKSVFQSSKQVLESRITTAEERVADKLDSVARQTEKFAVPVNRVLADSLIYFFRSAVQNHLTIKNFSVLAATENESAGNDKLSAVKWQTELQKKDKKIEQLEELLRRAADNKKNNETAGFSKANSSGFAKDFQEATNKNEYLEKVNGSLRQDNDRLLLEIAKMRQFTTNLEASVSDKVQTMERKVNDLNAALYLARVDCNLTRADAKQVVYNSRQRKDLLAEALKVLGNLSQSGDPALQQKIKEKTDQLQHISNTIRD